MPEEPNRRPPINRRRSRRFCSNGQAKMECRQGSTGLGRNLAIGALDISETGVRLTLRVALAVGQEVEILLHGPGFGKPRKRLGKII